MYTYNVMLESHLIASLIPCYQILMNARSIIYHCAMSWLLVLILMVAIHVNAQRDMKEMGL